MKKIARYHIQINSKDWESWHIKPTKKELLRIYADCIKSFPEFKFRIIKRTTIDEVVA